jgi:hypothetical protein
MNTIYESPVRDTLANTGLPLWEFINWDSPSIASEQSIKAGQDHLVLSRTVPFINKWISGSANNIEMSAPEYTVTHPFFRTTRRIEFSPIAYFPPMKSTFCVSATLNSSVNQDMFDQFFERIQDLFQTIVNDYVIGKVDVPDIVQNLGTPWTESTVVLLLELLGAYRPLSVNRMSQEKRDEILGKLAQIRKEGKLDEFNTENWIQREVTASQRIESVYVWPK